MSKKIILWHLLILWSLVIFFFSSQPAEESSALSFPLAEALAYFINAVKNMAAPVFRNLDIFDFDFLINNLETIIRKCAHFSVYAVLGSISFSLFYCYTNKKSLIFFISLLYCVLYAISDEFHQLFVPGRCGHIIDVGIDSLGAAIGIFITSIVIFKISKRKKKRS